MVPSTPSTALYEHLFHTASAELVVPDVSKLSEIPSDGVDRAEWWAGVREVETRQVAFLDEKVTYLFAVTIPNHAISDSSLTPGVHTPGEVQRFVSRLQATMTASFIPPLPSSSPRHDLPPPSTATLAPPSAHTPRFPTSSAESSTQDSQPPITPNPFPITTAAESQYADVEGVVIWEGPIELQLPQSSSPQTVLSLTEGKKQPIVFENESGWVIVWEGEVPIAFSISTSSIRSGFSDGFPEPEIEDEDEDLAGMEEIDLLGGLTGTTLRKAYRRILDLSPGLRVRMRTLFLPQLLELGSEKNEEIGGQKKIVLCVEVENPPDAGSHGFEVLGVMVEVGGKGGKATTELCCVPSSTTSEQKDYQKAKVEVFPLRLRPMEQYNLLYTITLPFMETSPTPDQPQRPVSIIVTSQPYSIPDQSKSSIPSISSPLSDESHLIEQVEFGISKSSTRAFQSRWNCTLDLSSYKPSPSPSPSFPSNRTEINKQPSNAITGDKRYSLASMLSDKERDPNLTHHRNSTIQGGKPMMPSQIQKQTILNRRVTQTPLVEKKDRGLLLSAKILTSSNNEGGEDRIRRLEMFTMEVFVHNRSEEIRRFRLSIPGRNGLVKGEKVMQDGLWGISERDLKQALQTHLATSPALLPLENDIRCGPLLPGASLSARIRFLALRDGVHRIDRLKVIGVGEEWEWTVEPVLDVVVG
ncbi:hypothetical protein TREMEDRAFT_71234 [Tremella mesenterica DSM 1558]|uniref:uncharacterized protein n=1 Tax=Tremella mesenterica (strain ATCC 24925 / CBS 8224 / DSM 1558 / NBRC 9311 / NRRL Y-6157 / RJB 2259-6 / UBC 559-6) TaxID=578456 RepID=UPI0003F499A8|nr:uncharacterized protein TREMEDRAFT_71234 [Tremella mesenterica DSM 1558]EIW71683.1 hypothetical protein TREMEDRAFT_71234 [Tremella mesenterica DSM 1558]